MSTQITNKSDIIDSRDIIERIEELEAWLDSIAEDDPMRSTKLNSADAQELAALKTLTAECEQYADDWQYGETLIRVQPEA